MNEFVRMSARDRRLACLQAEEVKHLQTASVEKDFWVCWTLRELFALPEIGPHLTFKGGTSLSKGWGRIDRFSEDIDFIVGREALGFGGAASPDQAPSGKQRKHRLKALKEACRAWVQEDLRLNMSHRRSVMVRRHRPRTWGRLLSATALGGCQIPGCEPGTPGGSSTTRIPSPGPQS